jgi:hypothetical protein
MPSDTDRSPVTHETAEGSRPGARPGGPTEGAQPVQQKGPVWPVTALIVLLGWCLLAWTVFFEMINTAPFFGEVASRDRYLESGMVALTALVPVALLLVLGLLAGSRWGLSLLALPALLLVPLGLSMLAEAGDPDKSGYGRGVRWDDAFADGTRLNWGTAALLVVAITALVWWRRRRRTGIRANP